MDFLLSLSLAQSLSLAPRSLHSSWPLVKVGTRFYPMVAVSSTNLMIINISL